MTDASEVKAQEVSFKDGIVHSILSHSYGVFFVAVILGSIFHLVFVVNFFSRAWYPYGGLLMILVGSSIIYWAQSSSRPLFAMSERTEKDFERGPYKYSRNPTHIGITIMTLGLALILNSFFIFIFTVAASVITKLIFLKAEEKILEQKYGRAYSEYKQKVNSWI